MVTKVPVMDTVKLVAAVLAVTTGPMTVARLVLQVTPSLVPRELSGWMIIWLFAVTAVVLTTTEVVAAAMTKDPAAADPHTAGEAADEQLVAVW